MPEMMTTDVRAIMDRSPFDAAAVADLRELLNRDPSRYRTLRDAVATIKEREKKEKETNPRRIFASVSATYSLAGIFRAWNI